MRFLSAPALTAYIAVTWAAICVGCNTERSAPSSALPADVEAELPVAQAPEVFRRHAEPRARLSFPIPAQGAEVEARQFDDSAPLHKIRHQLTVTVAHRRLVRIDIWDDPDRRELSVWAQQHLGFLLDDATTIQPTAVTPARLEGLLLEHSRSPQAHPRTSVLLATGGRVFRVTCLDSEDTAARAIFDRIVAELETEAAP